MAACRAYATFPVPRAAPPSLVPPYPPSFSVTWLVDVYLEASAQPSNGCIT